eukprot:3751909-Prymnesium_polylepis.1
MTTSAAGNSLKEAEGAPAPPVKCLRKASEKPPKSQASAKKATRSPLLGGVRGVVGLGDLPLTCGHVAHVHVSCDMHMHMHMWTCTCGHVHVTCGKGSFEKVAPAHSYTESHKQNPPPAAPPARARSRRHMPTQPVRRP